MLKQKCKEGEFVDAISVDSKTMDQKALHEIFEDILIDAYDRALKNKIDGRGSKLLAFIHY